MTVGTATLAPPQANSLRERAVSKADTDITPLVIVVGLAFVAGVVRRLLRDRLSKDADRLHGSEHSASVGTASSPLDPGP